MEKAFSTKNLPHIPIMFNPETIKKHTQLFILEDIGLADIMEQTKSDKLNSTAAAIKTAERAKEK